MLKSVFPLSNCAAVYLFPLIIIKHESEPSLRNAWQEWTTFSVDAYRFSLYFLLIFGKSSSFNFAENVKNQSERSRSHSIFQNYHTPLNVLADDLDLHLLRIIRLPRPCRLFLADVKRGKKTPEMC